MVVDDENTEEKGVDTVMMTKTIPSAKNVAVF